MNDKHNMNFPEPPEHYITEKSNADALRVWNHLAEIYEGQYIDSLSVDLLVIYCDNSQRIKSTIESINKNMNERINILQDMSDLQSLARFIVTQKLFTKALSLPKVLINHERRKKKVNKKATD